MRRLAAPLLLGLALAACDARPSTTTHVLGLATPPDWMKEDCRPESDESVLGVPTSRYWTCRDDRSGMRFRVDWWRGTAVAGQRRWWQPDSLAWERAQDSTAAALSARATPRPCTRDRVVEAPYVVGAVYRSRVWMLHKERRAVVMRSQWIPGHEPDRRGTVLVSTDTGEVDPCIDARPADFW